MTHTRKNKTPNEPEIIPSDPETTTTSKAPKSQRKSNRKARSVSPIPTDNEATIAATISPSLDPSILEMAQPIRLLVCSIGNPAPYHNTLHSAGHIVTSKLAQSHILSSSAWHISPRHGNGFLRPNDDSSITLWQSRSLMNISGSGVAAAWRAFSSSLSSSEVGKLVVIHDELELPLGEVKVKDGGASPKGHNGLKDIKVRMPGQEYTRIGVGIGRPQSREPEEVARYVLRNMSSGEKLKLEGAAGRVLGELKRIRGG